MPPPSLLRVDTAMTPSSSPSAASSRRQSSTRSPASSTFGVATGRAGGEAPRRRLSCSTPRCSSPVSSPLVAPSASSSPSPSSPPPPTSPPMSMTTYFGLLKKSQVLEQLLRLSGHVSAREAELQRLAREKSRADCVHARVFADLALFQTQFVDAQKCALELLEQLTAVCLGDSESVDTDTDAGEERTLRDLQRYMASGRGASASSRPGSEERGGGVVSVETQALRAVGRDRVRQIKDVMRNYERQLVGLEGELSRAVHSSTVKELTARVQELEAREQRHVADNTELTEQLRRSLDQQRDLQARMDYLQDVHAALDDEKRAADQLLDAQGAAIEQFGTALRAQLRRRYGTAPSVLDQCWREFFPTIPLPL